MDVDYLSPVAARATRTGSVSSSNGTVYTTIPLPLLYPRIQPDAPSDASDANIGSTFRIFRNIFRNIFYNIFHTLTLLRPDHPTYPVTLPHHRRSNRRPPP